MIKNGTRIDTVWYNKSSHTIFNINGTGSYKAVCFIKESDSIIAIIESEEMFFYENKEQPYYGKKIDLNLNIFGSCVSRDILEFDKENLFNFNLGVYVVRQAIVSSISLKNDITPEEINLNSNFQKRMVLSDFHKDCFDLFNKNKSEYLMIDLIDERFRVAESCGSIVTYSPHLAESGYKKDIRFIDYNEIDNKYYFQGYDLDMYLSEFCRRILRTYSGDKIIIHKAKMLDFYKSLNGDFKKFDNNIVRRNAITNKRIDYIYNFLEKTFKTPIVIDICHSFYADEKNKWGLAPMHYCPEYYNRAIIEIHKQMVQRQ